MQICWLSVVRCCPQAFSPWTTFDSFGSTNLHDAHVIRHNSYNVAHMQMNLTVNFWLSFFKWLIMWLVQYLVMMMMVMTSVTMISMPMPCVYCWCTNCDCCGVIHWASSSRRREHSRCRRVDQRATAIWNSWSKNVNKSGRTDDKCVKKSVSLATTASMKLVYVWFNPVNIWSKSCAVSATW